MKRISLLLHKLVEFEKIVVMEIIYMSGVMREYVI